MALQLKDRIFTLCTSTGTGDAVIGATKEGYQGWEGITYGNTVYYCITDDADWEVGYGNYLNRGSTQAITRTVLSSSDNGAKIPLSGNASIFCTYPSEKAVYRNKDNNLYFPTSNAHLKSILGTDVTSANVVTSAVIVDGTEGVNDSNLAGLLNVYKKDEIDEQQEVQDVQIEKNKQNIIELEEEIEAIAPSFDRGEWDYKAPSLATDLPAEGNYFILDASGNSITSFANAHEVLFNNKDVYDAIHTWGTVEVGQYLELFDSLDGEYLLAKIDVITPEPNAIRFEVTPQQSEGVAGGGSDRVRIKIFEIAGVDVDTLMPKTGGTFTGQVKHKKEIIIEPTLPSRFVNIKNRYATNPDGSSPGAQGQGFGVNFDLDHGNSGYNQVKWSNRNGDILNISGGTGANAKYTGKMTDDTHLVNKKYLDDTFLPLEGGELDGALTIKKNTSVALDIIGAGNESQFTVWSSGGVVVPNYTAFKDNELVTKKYVDTYSLTSGPESYRKKGNVVLGDKEFGVVASSVGSTNVVFLNKLYLNDAEGVQLVKDYEATDNTWFEVYKNSALILRMQIKKSSWRTSGTDANQIQFNGVYTYPLVGLSENWSGTTNYKIALTGLKKVLT